MNKTKDIARIIQLKPRLLRIIDKDLVKARNIVIQSIMDNIEDISRLNNKSVSIPVMINYVVQSIMTKSIIIEKTINDTIEYNEGLFGKVTTVGRRSQFNGINDIGQYLVSVTRYLLKIEDDIAVQYRDNTTKSVSMDTLIISIIPVSSYQQDIEHLLKLITSVDNIDKTDVQTISNIVNNSKDTTNSIPDIISKAIENTEPTNVNKYNNMDNHIIVILQSDGINDIISGVPTIITTDSENTFVQNSIVKKLDNDSIKSLRNIIYADIETTSLVTPVPNEYSMDRIAGYDFIKDFVNKRKMLLKNSSMIEKHGITLKGLFLIGVPGTGKSTMAKCIGNELEIPTYEMHIESAFDKHFGATENKILSTLDLLEKLGRVVVIIDEIDKLFAGVSTGMTGNDVPIRVFGILLKHMARENTNIMFIATANDMNLPSSFTRKGRFDKIFFVDVPDEDDRTKIVKYYVDKFKMKDYIDDDMIDIIVKNTEEWTGGDIESLIKEITIDFIVNKKGNNMKDIITNELSKTSMSVSHEEISKMRKLSSTFADNLSYIDTI